LQVSDVPRMKGNITLALDTALLRDLRVLAAEEDTSISALLTTRIEQIVRERKAYDRAQEGAWHGCVKE
jgi:hypothetical protein